MTTSRVSFIDWMKCLGMALIVFGHVSSTGQDLIPPIYPKQLGVAFFLFISGVSLARETRTSREVLFKRLFEIYLFGISFALLMSAITYARISRLSLSNYLPFLFGSNVIFDNFPANPTTWFIGTYLHILVLWAVALRRLRIRPWMLVLTVIAEVVIRAALMESAGRFVAYMLLPNWASVFLLGMYCGQRYEVKVQTTSPVLPFLGLCLLFSAWAAVSRPVLHPKDSFPFMQFSVGSSLADAGVTSAAVTFIYLSYTWSVYHVACRLPTSTWVRFFARNTPIIFIAHMPVYYALGDPLSAWTKPYSVRAGVYFFTCFVLLAFLSEFTRRMVQPEQLRNWLWFMGTRSIPLKETVCGSKVIALGSRKSATTARGRGITAVNDRVAHETGA